ncbi:MAG: methyltransferase [Spirosomataceae bacterium]
MPFFDSSNLRVWHDRCALRVCTEACILGAYTELASAHHALDIGTGTGLLALMLAQRNANLTIDAIEIEQQHVEQALENVKQSPFSERISVFHEAIQTWEKVAKYDLIVSNPPFFAKHLRSSNAMRNSALHTETLSLQDLAFSVTRLLAQEGRFVVLLPPTETQRLMTIFAPLALYPTHQLAIFSHPSKPLFRQITTFEYRKSDVLNETLYIHDLEGQYSSHFQTLLKDYYLIF